MWALAAIDGGSRAACDETLLLETLGDTDAFVRSWGVRLVVDGCAPGGLQPSAAALKRLLDLAASDLSPPVQLHLASAVGRLADDPAWALATAVCRHDRYAADPQLPNLVWYGLAKSAPRHPDRGLALAVETALPRVRRNLARLLAGRIEDRKLIFDRKAIEIIGRVEPTQADQALDPVAIPNQTVVEDNLLDTGSGSQEMAAHGQRVDQETGAALQFEEQIVTVAQQ